MIARRWLVIAGTLTFVVVLIARLPASWLRPLLPAAVGCSSLTGTAWNGACRDTRLTLANAAPRELGLLRWDLQPLQLLAGRIAGHVDLASPSLSANAQVSVSVNGRLAVRRLTLSARAEPGGLPLLPPDWRGDIRLRDAVIEVGRDRLHALSGSGELLGLTSLSGDRLGGYRVDFPVQTAAALGPGLIEDAGDGPLDVEARLSLEPSMAWQIDGSVSATPRAGEALQRWIQYLGSPDAAGRRPFSLAGSLR